jgi:DNA-binding NarL/FixJ family response regulator
MVTAQPQTALITVVLADDHHVVRQALRGLLDRQDGMKVIDEAPNGEQAIRLVESARPDVLVVDLAMPDMNGFAVAEKLQSEVPETAIIVLSMYSNVSYVVEALLSGATGYVLKEAPAHELVSAIRSAVRGERYLSTGLDVAKIDALMTDEQAKAGDPWLKLTAREHQVLQMAAAGLTSRQIAEKLEISTRTAEKHRANLMKKLGLKTPAQMVRYVMERGPQPMPH